MSSWLLQLALLAACLRCGCAEGDPLPPALVELVRSSPITSIQDLQLLLLTDSVEEDPDSQMARGLHSNYTFNRLPRSLDAQPAQQAQCKVRTEVLEVTRAMLDRRNANFMLWPPCVEVQRCSGCCNARTMHCVPIVTHTRYLQVMKIQYVNMRPHYDKAVISVQDHVECRCQSAPPQKGPRAHSKKLHPRRQNPKNPQVRARPKEELHRLDELKPHQKSQLGDMEILGQRWRPPDAYMLPAQTEAEGREGNSLPGHDLAPDPDWQTSQVPRIYNHTRQRGAGEPGGRPRGFEFQNDYQDAGASGVHREGVSGAEPWHPDDGRPRHPDDRRPRQQNLTEDADPHRRNLTDQRPAEEARLPDWGPDAQMNRTETESPPLQRGNASQQLTELGHPHNHSHAEESDRREHDQTQHRANGTGGRQMQLLEQEQQNLEEEKRELLLLHRKLDEEKQRLKEQQQQHHHHDHQHHHVHYQTHVQTTTQRAETVPPTTTKPPAPPTFRPPSRPAPPRRRMRKNRNRISKAAMRAMLM
ncbi:uncharacterized protein pdgfbb [Megalops cyprinoides]|uniref:uncharacterized protein pdgfbb n=1 Tax=Megalops cyprinoides TaxID=118141 RepID=UPI0018652E2D|nr:uncharacterized protein pdgfbb [Megalops cyprinoides]